MLLVALVQVSAWSVVIDMPVTMPIEQQGTTLEPLFRLVQSRFMFDGSKAYKWPDGGGSLGGYTTDPYPPNGWYGNYKPDVYASLMWELYKGAIKATTVHQWVDVDLLQNGVDTIPLIQIQNPLVFSDQISYTDMKAKIKELLEKMNWVAAIPTQAKERSIVAGARITDSFEVTNSDPNHWAGHFHLGGDEPSELGLDTAIGEMLSIWGSNTGTLSHSDGTYIGIEDTALLSGGTGQTYSDQGQLEVVQGLGIHATNQIGTGFVQNWYTEYLNGGSSDLAQYIWDIPFKGTGNLWISLHGYNYSGSVDLGSGMNIPVDDKFYGSSEILSGSHLVSFEYGARAPINLAGAFAQYDAAPPYEWTSSRSGRTGIKQKAVYAVLKVDFQVPNPTACEDLCICGNYTTKGKGGGAVDQTTSPGGSTMNNLLLTYRHEGVDFRASGAASGCKSCGSSSGGAGVPPLEIVRIHAPDLSEPGSLGWGVFLGQDIWITGFIDERSTDYLDLMGPKSFGRPTRFEKSTWASTAANPKNPKARAVVWTTAAGISTTPKTAAYVEITGWNERSLQFELCHPLQYGFQSGSIRGRLVRDQDAHGNATRVVYRYALADIPNEIAGEDLRHWRQIASLIGADGTVATLTQSPTLIGGGYPVTQIDVSTGEQIRYHYGNLGIMDEGTFQMKGLTSVEHADGSVTTVQGVHAVGGGLLLTITDPAEEAADHQVKTVQLSGNDWVNPATGNFEPFRVRAVWNGAQELTYANRRVVTDSEWWTVIFDRGDVYRLVTDQLGYPMRTDHVTAAVDWATDPTTWPWEKQAAYAITGNRLTNAVDALGRSKSWEVDPANGLVVGTTDAAGGHASQELDAAGRVVVETDRLGRVTTYERDATGNVLSSTRGAGTADAVTESATYNAQGLPLTRTDVLGHTTEYTYDATGHLLTETAPADVAGGPRAVTEHQYDASGRLVASIDPVGRRVQYLYDARNRQTKTIYADASFEETIYGTAADAGRVIGRRDRNGVVTGISYDLAGRRSATVTLVPHADGTTESLAEGWTYLPGTTQEASSTRRGETTLTSYDGRHRRIASTVYATRHATLTTSWTYDAADRQLTETDAFGRVTYQVYDDLDRVVRTVRETVPGGLPAGADPATISAATTGNPGYVIDETSYDAEGQVAMRTDARGSVTAFIYDVHGRLASQIEAKGTAAAATTSFFYDALGNQVRIEHPRHRVEPGGFVTMKSYTGRGLLATVTEAANRSEQGTMSYRYTLDGKPAQVIDANGHVAGSEYGTCCARLMKSFDAAGFQTTFDYDAVGNQTSITDANGFITLTTYDAVGRPVTRTDAAGRVSTYRYDDNLTDGVGLDAAYAQFVSDLDFGHDPATGFGADGSAVAMTDADGHTTLQINDGLGRMVRAVDALGHATTTKYDSVVTDVVVADDGSTTSSKLVATVTTNALDEQTTRLVDGLGAVRVVIDPLGKKVRMTHDAAGQTLRVRDANGVGQDLVYDARGRVTMVTDTAGDGHQSVVKTQYDVQGNRVARIDGMGGSEQWQYDGRNRAVQQRDRNQAVTSFGFDAIGNLVRITDAEGGVTAYVYDQRNLLVRETFPGPTGGTRRYSYDPGRRLLKRIEAPSAMGGN